MFCPDTSRYIYEPRAYWQVVSIDVDTSNPPPPSTGLRGRVRLDQQRFRNVSRYPIVLTHLLLSPIGYQFRSAPEVPSPTLLTQVDASLEILNRMQIAIAAPFSAHFNAWDMAVNGFRAVPTAVPSTVSIPENPSLDEASNLLGVSRWNFHTPLEIARRASVRFDLSTYPVISSAAIGGDLSASVLPVSSVLVEEVGIGPLGGQGRIRPRAMMPASVGTEVFPAGGQPVPPDAYGFAAPNTYTNQTPAVWAPNQAFPAKEYQRQESNRGGTATQLVSGFAVHVDQILYEDAVLTALGGDYKFAPGDTRVATRARIETGGTQEWWWEPGAPLALVCPTMTTALTKEMESPIWLAQGEGLDIELQVSTSAFLDALSLFPVYNFGVSFCGYACVEK